MFRSSKKNHKRKREAKKGITNQWTNVRTNGGQMADECPDKRPPENRDKRIENRNNCDESRQNRKEEVEENEN